MLFESTAGKWRSKCRSNKKEEVWVVEKRKRMNEQMETGLNVEWEDRGQGTRNGEEN